MNDNKPQEITDSQFEEAVINCKGFVLVDFWAPWCGPCHTMAPALEAFAAENRDTIKVYKLDVDDNPKTAERYEIRSIPTLIFFKDGEKVDMNTGALSQASLQSKLENLL